MHIVITDSGVGGLSVVAYAERFVRTNGFREPVRLTFANAAPANDYGYNSMPSRHVKLETFDRFLKNVAERCVPDSIYVACNTLSVLLPDTLFASRNAIPVKGIVETAVDLLLRELHDDPASIAMIFGTQTTIDAGAYPRLLAEAGATLPAGDVSISTCAIPPTRIVSQACPGLADTISEDREGTNTGNEIRHWVNEAIAKMPDRNAPVVACLACTHYGYRKEMFAAALADAGIRATVINPNERAVDDLFPSDVDRSIKDVEVEFITRYAIPPSQVEALTYFLEEISPKTVAAMRNFIHVPDLF